MMEKDAKIYVAGHRGMVGSAILRELKKEGYHNFVLRTHKELNLCRQDEVEKFFAEEKPDYVFREGDVLIVSGSRDGVIKLSEWAVKADHNRKNI